MSQHLISSVPSEQTQRLWRQIKQIWNFVCLKYPKQYLNNMTKKLQMYSLYFNFKILALMFSIFYVCIFNSNISAIYPSVYTVCIGQTGCMKHETELYLRNQISFSVCASIIGSSSLFPRGRSPYVL